MAEKCELQRRNDAELGRNQNLTGTLYGLESKKRTCEENFAVSRREKEDLGFSN